MNIFLKILIVFVVIALINTLMIGFSVLHQRTEDRRRESRRRNRQDREE